MEYPVLTYAMLLPGVKRQAHNLAAETGMELDSISSIIRLCYLMSGTDLGMPLLGDSEGGGGEGGRGVRGTP
eukprot:3829939-Rhodomonas_salina.1